MRKGSECLGTGQRPLDYQNDSQPASSIVAASSFSFFFPFCRRTAAISLPHQQLQCQGPRAIAPSASREMFYLFEVLRPPWSAPWCVYFRVFISSALFLHIFSHTSIPCTFWLFFFCAFMAEIFAFCAHFYTKKKAPPADGLVASDPSGPTPAPGKGRWKGNRRSPLTTSSPHGQKFSLCRFYFSLIFCASRQFLGYT